MFLNPKTAIEKGWVTGIKNPEVQLQPNALDFTLDKVYQIRTNNTFVISEEGKQMRGTDWVDPILDRATGLHFWDLRSDNLYDGLSYMYVDLPDGVAAMLVTRSTFSRNGVFITSGLYDSGFKGHIGFAIHNRARQRAKVGEGTRIGQIIFVESQNSLQYAGEYNHEEGTVAPHIEKEREQIRRLAGI